VAGVAAGLAWRAVEPGFQRLFGHPYSDPELATAFVTRGRAQPVLDYLVQGAGGGLFALFFVRLGGRRPRQAVTAVLAENAVLLAAAPLIDRIHPDVRDGTWAPLTGNARAAAVSVAGHALYAALLAASLRA
jgi:hypothetical protein